MTIKIKAALPLAVCLISGFATPLAIAQAGISPGQPAVHIAIRVRELTGNPLPNLRASSFKVSSRGAPLPFLMAPAALAHRSCVLIVVAPGVTGDLVAYLSSEVPRSLPATYSLSAMGPDGAFVGPVQTSSLLSRGFLSKQVVYKGYEQAIDELAACRGERSIIYSAAKSANPPLELVLAAEQAGALIYHAGGDPRQNFTYTGEPGTTSPPLSAGEFPLQTVSSPGGQTWENSASLSIRTVYVERSIRGAFHEIERVSHGWYEVMLALPQEAKTLELRTKIPGPYQMTAVNWVEGAAIAPVLTVVEVK